MSRTILVDDAVIAGLMSKLPRAALLGHSQRLFLEHLLCTWRILADWRMPRSVCRAGFLHSAYATTFYRHALFQLDERAAVRRMIGAQAEELAYRFCTMDRRTFWDDLVRRQPTRSLTYPDRHRAGAPVRVTRKTLSHLLIIESANVAEQNCAPDGGPVPWMSRLLHWWEFLEARSIPVRLGVRPRLSKRADEAAIAAYRTALNLPERRAMRVLDEAIRQNPWVAEPRILRALCTPNRHDAGARPDAQEADALLSAWSVAWDKRLSLNAWKALSKRNFEKPRSSRSAILDFSAVCSILNAGGRKPRWLSV